MLERHTKCDLCEKDTVHETFDGKFYDEDSDQGYWEYKRGGRSYVCRNCVTIKRCDDPDCGHCGSLFRCQGCDKVKSAHHEHPDAWIKYGCFTSWCFDCYTRCKYCDESGKEIAYKQECRECVDILRQLVSEKKLGV